MNDKFNSNIFFIPDEFDNVGQSIQAKGSLKSSYDSPTEAIRFAVQMSYDQKKNANMNDIQSYHFK